MLEKAHYRDGAMFFDKLWIRIKGELLALKEDDSVTEDLRAKAGKLLDHVQERVKGAQESLGHAPIDSNRERGRAEIRSQAEQRDLADIEEEWRKLAKDRDRQKKSAKEEKPLAPNPRQLG